MGYSRRQVYLLSEFVVLFFGTPLAIMFFSDIIHPSSILVPLLVGILIVLRFRTSFRFSELLYLRISKRHWLRHLAIITVVAVLIVVVLQIFKPEALFNLPKGNLKLWLILVIFYPLFSAFAQEIIYRSFMFKRYKPLFPNSDYFVVASGISFSFAHILYYHPISLVLTFFMGIYLARQYVDTRSVLFTSILHGILGNLAFTLGLGEYFWLDMLENI